MEDGDQRFKKAMYKDKWRKQHPTVNTYDEYYKLSTNDLVTENRTVQAKTPSLPEDEYWPDRSMRLQQRADSTTHPSEVLLHKPLK